MIDLEKFLEPIELAGTPLKDHRAYRMDGESPQPDILKGALSRKIVDEVEVLPADEFIGKLSEHTITS
ncbi:MAG: hypothetical protein J4F29_21755 [Candidatus Latescibacteria bacterium]|nr:hypothetical protein [Candidatus Latescibacterota bacterium]